MFNRFRHQSLFLLLFAFITVSSNAFSAVSKSIIFDSAAVVCAEELAAQAGFDILKAGGNAIDALTTVAFTMAVTYPRAGNIGGGGFLVYRDSKGKVTTLDFRETAPKAAASDLYLDENQNPIKNKSLVGALAVGVPGTVKGLYQAHQKYGKLNWAHLLQPAIDLARYGFPIRPFLRKSLEEKEKYLQKYPETRRIFFPNGELLREGELLVQPDLANTLEKIAQSGDSIFYEGEIANKIVATIQKYGGILSKQDFADYKAVYRPPVVINYQGYSIYSMPPPSSGGLVLEGMLNTLQQTELSKKFDQNSADYIAFISEIEKRWYAYRNLYLGDPDFVKIPFDLFSSPEKAEEIFSSISTNHPLPSEKMPEFRQIENQEKSETTHISILDAQGNAVAMTYTLNGSYGSYLIADGTGILLNNEMDDFTAKPGSPNLYGLVQGWANAIEPGKRMLSSMAPTIVEKDGNLGGMLGTPGGSTIITSVFQILLNKIDYHMSLNEAMMAGRFHHQWLPDSIYYEQHKFSGNVITELNRRGFKTKPTDKIGDIQAIWRYDNRDFPTEASSQSNGASKQRSWNWEACSDFNGYGTAIGY